MKYRSHKVNTYDLEGMEAELSMQPSPIMDYVDPVIAKNGELIAIGYLVDDYDPLNPLEDCDGMGRIYASLRHSSTQSDMQNALGLNSDWERDFDSLEVEGIAEQKLLDLLQASFQADLVAFVIEKAGEGVGKDKAINLLMQDIKGERWEYWSHSWLALKFLDTTSWEALQETAWEEAMDKGLIGDPYAVSLDVYEHGGQFWSLSGGGMQCQWDTSRGAGVWVPDEYLREELDSIKERDGMEAAREKATEFAGQALEPFNSWLSGDCYGLAVDVYLVESGKLRHVDDSAVYGYIGRKWAEEALGGEVEGMLSSACRKAA